MTEFIHALFTYPSALYTGLMGIAILYWLFVIVGAVDIDLFGSGAEGALDGATEGATQGAIEGASHGVADGVADGLADGVADGLADGVADGLADGAADGLIEGASHGASEGAAQVGGETALATIIGSLKLRNAPVTVVYSVYSLAGWAMTMGAEILLHPLVQGLIPGWIFGTASLVLSFPLSLMLASVSIKPLAPLFVHTTHRGHQALIGKSCVVATGHVDGKFGQVKLIEPGLDLILQARSFDGQTLDKNTEALIVDYDVKQDLYHIEELEKLLRS